MRLTLRTLLAYLDGILEPNDAQELGQRIKESKSASDIVKRIRTSICRVRLPAPKLEGKGIGLDANTVAEYLDNTLPADRVPDFEKVCLESDMHLAEVAASHQILTLVLGEPAEVTPRVRDRVYRLASLDVPASPAAPPVTGEINAAEVDAPPVEHPPVAGNGSTKAATADDSQAPAAPESSRLVEPPAEEPSVEEPVSKAARGKPEVPDYLLATRRASLWPAALMLLLVFAVVFVGLLIIWPQFSQSSLAHLLTGKPGTPQENASDTDGGPGTAETKGPNKTDGQVESTDKPQNEKGDGSNQDDGAPASILPAEDPTLPGEDGVVPVVPGSTTPPGPAVTPPEPDESIVGGTPSPTPPKPATPAPETPTPAPETPTPTPPAPAKPDEATTPTTGIDVGRFISDEQVLAVEKPGETWVRLPTLAPLVSGNRLLALPSFRPQLALVPGMHVTLTGPAMAKLGAPVEEGTPMMEIEYGRALLVTSGRANAKIGLRLGNRMGVARFDSVETKLAVDVSRYLPPGADPELPPPGAAASALPIVRLYVLQGRIEWTEEGGAVAAINANQVRLLVTDRPGQTVDVKTLPEWISPSAGAADPDRLASRTIDAYLKPDTSILLALNELLADRRVEVRSLAVRCLGYLGHFEPFIDELTNAQQKSYWDDAFDALQAALARDAAAAARVRSAFEERRGKDGSELYRMLWGYSPKQLEAGADTELVAHLENERMDFRVLAFENLRRITGKTLLYRPEYTVRKNQPYVQRWRELVEEKGVVYQSLPTPLPELEGAPMPMPAEDAATGAPGILPSDAPASPLDTPKPLTPEPRSPAPDGVPPAAPEAPGRSF